MHLHRSFLKTIIRTILYWLVSLALLSPLLIGVPAHAQTYSGLDIVFLVDQSGSMGGAAFGLEGRTPTDPLGLRFDAVQYALDTLGEYRVNIAPDLGVRMAVVAFGDDTELMLDWTELAPDRATWEATRDDLLATLAADTFGRRNLGDTNFRAAFQQAGELFDGLGRDPTRLRVVVLLTDGDPCVSVGDLTFDCSSVPQQQTFMGDLLVQTTATFDDPNDLIYVMALDATARIWNRWQDEWQAVTEDPARATRLETNAQIGTRFRDILTELIGIVRGTASQPANVLLPGQNSVPIPPYHQLVRVSIFKSTLAPGVLTVTQPDGSPPDPATVTITGQDRPIEVWTIRDPQPGNWVFAVGANADEISVYLELIPFEVDARLEAGEARLFDGIPFTLTLSDTAGDPLPIYSDYPLNTTALVTLPAGTTETLALTMLTGSTFEGTISARQPGTYRLGVAVTVQADAETRITLVDQPEIASFTIDEVVLVVDPLPTRDYLIGEVQPVTARLLEAGLPVDLASLEVVATLRGSDGSTVDYPLTRTDTGVYSADIPFDRADDYTLTALATAGGLPVGDLVSQRVRVLPSRPITLERTQPIDDVQYATEGFPPLTPTNLVIGFVTRSQETGQPVDMQALAASSNPVLSITWERDGEPLAEPPIWIIDAPGVYSARLVNPPTGQYTITVRAAGELTDRYLLSPDARVLTFSIERVVNPALIAFWAGVATVVGLVLLLIVIIALRRRAAMQHPARGSLAFLRAEGGSAPEIMKVIALGGFNANTITLKKKDLPRDFPLTRLTVRCASPEQSKAGRITLTGEQNGVRVLDDHPLPPGGTVSLRPPAAGGKKRRDKGKSAMPGNESFSSMFGGQAGGTPGQVTYLLQKDADQFGTASTTSTWFS